MREHQKAQSRVLLFMCAAGCGGSFYGRQICTIATPVAPSFDQAPLEAKPVAILPALSTPVLRGTEVGLSYIFSQILKTLTPNWTVVGEQAVLTGINKHGLGTAYTLMRRDAEDSHLLGKESLRKIGAALGVRYIFQPRLASFRQIMTERWKVPAFDIRVAQTRSSLLQLSLQLWDAETGELIWSSVAEAILANETISQDPVFFEDAARVALGSLMADFLNRRTASIYTPLNDVLDKLVREAIPEERKRSDSGGDSKEK